jgi:alcohol dehydrogenase class IV
MKREYSSYQKGIIDRYYQNLNGIALQNLQELVTELFLAEDEKKKAKLWDRVKSAMEKLKIPPQIANHILEKKDIQVLAKNVAEWVSKKK